MVLDDTKLKLAEAAFFLAQARSVLTNPIVLSYYLSAFISAARSVTLFMQKELGKDNTWYDNRIKEEKNRDSIFTIFNQLRVITIHERKIIFSRKVHVAINEPPITIRDSVSMKVIRNGVIIKEFKPSESGPGIDEPESSHSELKVEVFFENQTSIDGIKLCDQYMTNLVSDAEEMLSEK